MSLNAGIMNMVENPLVCDNFFLGGPLSIRGFDFRALGPGSEGSFTGGTVIYIYKFNHHTRNIFIFFKSPLTIYTRMFK
jgi:outer membrane protein assembly factor BamA